MDRLANDMARQQELAHSPQSVIAVTWPCIAVIGVLLFISAVSMVALSATRAYVTGDSIWTRAERETSVLLIEFCRSGSPETLAELNAQMNVVLGDRSARLELLKARPNYGLAHRGLLAGDNEAADVPSMIWLFRATRLFGVAREPLRIWDEADEQFLRYLPLKQAAIALRGSGEPSPAAVNDLVRQVHLIHEPLALLEQRFAAAIGSYARNLTAFFLEFLAASTAVLLPAGYLMSRRLVRRAGAMATAFQVSQNQVFAEQERARVLLGSISDAVIATDRNGAIEFLNAAAEHLTGWSASEARGQPLENVFRVASADDAGAASIREAINAVLAEGRILRLSTYGAQLVRRDQSTTPIGERAAPLHNRAGDVVGMVLVMRDVTAERDLWEKLRHQADHDALTGLANRAHFERRLELSMQECADDGMHFTVMFIDLDEFKVVNDTCGHRAGDDLLRRIGTCIQGELRSGDLLARLGGDEFGVLLPPCDVNTAAPIAERVRQAVAALQFAWNGRTFAVRTSIGMVSDESALRSVIDVLGAADRACYAAKKAGRNCVRIYSAAEDSRSWRSGETYGRSA